MSEETFHVTGEDVRKLQSQASKNNDGNVPKNSDAAALQSLIAEKTESKEAQIDRVKANLPLPDDPPTASDWNSADGRTVNVGSGGVESDIYNLGKGGSDEGLRGPATADSSVRVDGEEFKKNTAP